MKAFLLYKDQDFDLQRKLPSNELALTQDLELETLFNAMCVKLFVKDDSVWKPPTTGLAFLLWV